MYDKPLSLLEKAFLFYAGIGKIRTSHSEYPYFMKDFNCAMIRDFLIAEKLIKSGSAEECLYVYPYKELQRFLNAKGLKPGNRRNVTVKRIIENSLTEECADTFGYLCYLPTEAARQLYQNYTVNDFYEADIHSELKALSIKKYNAYTKHDSEAIVSILKENETYIGSLKKDDSISELRKHNVLGSEYDICLYVENQFISEFKQIHYLFFLPHTHIVIFVKENHSLYTYQPFDFLNLVKLPYNDCPFGVCNVLEYEDFPSKKYKSRHSVLENEVVNYYVSSDNFTKLILSEIYMKLEKRVIVNDIEKIANEIDDNYSVKVPKEDFEVCEFIMYLFRTGYLHFPTIMNVQIGRIFSYMRYNMYIDVPIKQLFVQEYNVEHGHIALIIRELEHSGIHTMDAFLRRVLQLYPDKVVFGGDYRSYTVAKDNYQQDIYYKASIGKEDKYKTIYNKCLLKLKELNLIPTRWKNEFMLYLSVLKQHKDAVYQYRAKWLGLQSLDIYIPSLKIGLEYQGRQHYETVDYFGGEEGYQLRIALDSKKRQLCRENSVLLMEWAYTEDITDESVAHFLNQAKNKKR